MSFDWMNADINPSLRGREAEARVRVAEAELLERAALLRRMGCTPAEVLARCARTITWEHEGIQPVLSEARIAQLLG